MGYQVPPGIADATVPNPVFNLTPTATVDEGNNWINMSWGPLAEANPVSDTILGNYGPASTSSVINHIPSTALVAYGLAPSTDFFGNLRKTNLAVDAGAVEFLAGSVAGPTLTAIGPTSAGRGATNLPVTLTGTNLTGATAITISGSGVTHGAITVVNATTITTTFTINRAVGTLGAHTVTVTTPGGTSNSVTFTVTNATVAFAGPTPGLTSSPANTSTKTGTITVSNAASATGPFTLTAPPAVNKVGTAGGTFSVAGGTCVSGFAVNPGASCTITVQYAPGTSTATATANVTVAGTGTATATVTSPNFTAN